MSSVSEVFAPEDRDRHRKYYHWNNGKPYYEINGFCFEYPVGNKQHCLFQSEEQAVWAKHIFEAVGGFENSFAEDVKHGYYLYHLKLELVYFRDILMYAIEIYDRDFDSDRWYSIGYLSRCEHQPKLAHLLEEVTLEVRIIASPPEGEHLSGGSAVKNASQHA